MLVADAFAVPFGMLMAIPALRLHGLYLALASISFAAMAERVFFEQPEIFGTQGKHAGPITLLGWDTGKPFTVLGIHFGQDVGLSIVSSFAFVLVGMLVLLLRRGRLGRRLVALGDSEAACATIGINIIATKLQVFAISAAIAGFAGSILGVVYGVPDVNVFTMFFGLPYLLLAVVGGIATVSGAFLGGAFLQMFTFLNDKFPTARIFGWAFLSWQQKLGPGLVGIGIGRNPSGIIPTVGEDFRHKQAIKRAKQAGLPPPDEVEPPQPEIPVPETRPVPVEAAARAGTGAGDPGAAEGTSPDQGA